MLPKLHVNLDSRVLFHDVSRGQVPGFPYIATDHPDVRDRGLESAWFWMNRVALTYDSRDSRKIPKDGTFAEVYVDGSAQALGSNKSFVKWGVQAKTFHSFRAAKNPTLAMRAGIDWMTGDDDSPFYLLNAVGGRHSLRGFGSDRFIDFNRSLASVELRTRVWSHRLFGVDLDVEVAPFVDTATGLSRPRRLAGGRPALGRRQRVSRARPPADPGLRRPRLRIRRSGRLHGHRLPVLSGRPRGGPPRRERARRHAHQDEHAAPAVPGRCWPGARRRLWPRSGNASTSRSHASR